MTKRKPPTVSAEVVPKDTVPGYWLVKTTWKSRSLPGGKQRGLYFEFRDKSVADRTGGTLMSLFES